MKKIIAYIVFFPLCSVIYAQSNTKPCHNIPNNKHACNWSFSPNKELLTGKVLEFTPAINFCNWHTHAAIAIIKTAHDTFRAILPCLDLSFKVEKDQDLMLNTIPQPNHYVLLPVVKNEKKWISNQYDMKISNTIWAEITDSLPKKHIYFHDFFPIIGNSYAGKWEYNYNVDTISGTVLDFIENKNKCSHYNYGADVAIIKRANDTVRVILPCNNIHLLLNSTTHFHTRKKPTYSFSIPYSTSKKNANNNAEMQTLNLYDEVVTKTVIADVIKQ
jgi:hypothetical protein